MKHVLTIEFSSREELLAYLGEGSQTTAVVEAKPKKASAKAKKEKESEKDKVADIPVFNSAFNANTAVENVAAVAAQAAAPATAPWGQQAAVQQPAQQPAVGTDHPLVKKAMEIVQHIDSKQLNSTDLMVASYNQAGIDVNTRVSQMTEAQINTFVPIVEQNAIALLKSKGLM